MYRHIAVEARDGTDLIDKDVVTLGQPTGRMPMRFCSVLMTLTALMALTACAGSSQSPTTTPVQQPAPAAPPATSSDAPAGYEIVGKTRISLDGKTDNQVLFFRKQSLIGVLVQVDGHWVVLRKADPAEEGMVGPESDPKLIAQDFDRDGTPEILLTGFWSPHTSAAWVYHFDTQSRTFEYLDLLMGTAGVFMTEGPEGVTFTTEDPDHSAAGRGQLISQTYLFDRTKFKKTGPAITESP